MSIQMEWQTLHAADRPELLREQYRLLAAQLEALTEGEPDVTANLSNSAALLYLSLDQVNWAGFYLLKGPDLVLGPFQGKPACIRIPLGKGVCGTAAKENRTCLVPDVRQFPGHIACDGDSRSELVIPLRNSQGAVWGVLDLDSPILSRFSQEDRAGLEQAAGILSRLWERQE